MDAKLASFEERFERSQRQFSQTQISTIQSQLSGQDNYVFRKKGIEEQHKVNSQVLDRLRKKDGFSQ